MVVRQPGELPFESRTQEVREFESRSDHPLTKNFLPPHFRLLISQRAGRMIWVM